MAQLLINVGKQLEGYTFRLQPKSRLWLGQQYPVAPRVASVFISADTKQELANLHPQILHQVFTLLTGLPKEQLNSLDGLTVVDPQTGQALFKNKKQHV